MTESKRSIWNVSWDVFFFLAWHSLAKGPITSSLQHELETGGWQMECGFPTITSQSCFDHDEDHVWGVRCICICLGRPRRPSRAPSRMANRVWIPRHRQPIVLLERAMGVVEWLQEEKTFAGSDLCEFCCNRNASTNTIFESEKCRT